MKEIGKGKIDRNIENVRQKEIANGRKRKSDIERKWKMLNVRGRKRDRECDKNQEIER